MDFKKVTFDDAVDELDDEDARSLVNDFQKAQEQNIAEFEKASEQIDDLEGTFGDFEDADEELTADVAEATFMSEDEAAELEFSRKREILAEFSEEDEGEDGGDGEDDGDGGDGEAEFSNMGQRGETHDEEEAEKNFAEEYLGGIQGLEL